MKKQLVFLCMLSLTCTMSTQVYATSVLQEVKSSENLAKGIVVDESGQPIIGVFVQELGTTKGTVTDANGSFSLQVSSNAKLKFSFLGYKTVTAKPEDNMRIVLQEDNTQLNEVVVVGYGSQKKANLTGAVASIDVNKTLGSRPIADVGRGLQGSTPGLSIVIPDAEIGSDPTIKIRGQIASLNGSSSPLILLDNVEIPSITMVNPDDIESITVLKDAAASSIYGAKAAFGVILINTKKGAKTDAVNVTYSNNFAWKSTEKDYNMGGLSGYEYTVDAMKNANLTNLGAFFKASEEGLERARQWEQTYGGKISSNDPTVYGRDWYVDANGRKIGVRSYDAYDYMVRNNAPSQQHNFSINGRSGSTSYHVGLGYMGQEGMNKVAKCDKFERYNASMNLTTELNKYVTLKFGTIYSKSDKRFPFVTSSSLDQWYYLYRWSTYYPMGYDENGNELRSPAEEYHQANTSKFENNYTNINLGAHLDFTKNWSADIDYTHANEDINWLRPGTKFTAADTWSGAIPRVDSNGNNVYVNTAGEVVASTVEGAMQAYDLRYLTYTGAGSTPDYINRRATNSKRDTWNAYTTYNLKLDKYNAFKFMLGLNTVNYVREYNESQRKELLDITNPQFGNATGEQTVDGSKTWESQAGFFGRLNYNLMEKYLLEANLRYDGTSKFPNQMQWRWFPSFSAGWRISEENFMKWAKPVLSTLKFRGSYGIIGDQTVPNTLYTSNLGQITQSDWLIGTNKANYVYAPTAVASDITWQDIRTLDFGLDARFFNNDLGVTLDWYQRDTKNMIVPEEGIPATYGVSAPSGNFGNLRTRGWELSIDYNHRFANGLGINGMFSLSDAKTIITDYGNATSIDGWYNGKEYGEIWGYRTDRLYQKDDFQYDNSGNLIKTVLTNANGAKNAGKTVYQLKGDNPVYQGYLQAGSFMFQPGDVKYQDLDGDKQITDGSRSIKDHGDLTVIGNTTPRYEWGLRLGADYKGFDLSVFLQGVGKRDMWGSSSTTLAGFNVADGAIAKRFSTNYWREDRTDAFYPRAWNLGNSTNALDMCVQDRYLLNMAYTRVKNITLGYTLPDKYTRYVWVKQARFYISLENFFTFDHLKDTPVDPEVVPGVGSAGLLSSSNYQLGRAGISTPAFKTFSIGVQLNF